MSTDTNNPPEDAGQKAADDAERFAGLAEQPPMDDAAGGPQVKPSDEPEGSNDQADADVPTEGGDAAKDSEAHPS